VPCQGLDGESLVADLNVPASAWQSVPLPVEAVLQADRPTTAKLSFRVDGEEKAVRSVQLPAGSSTVVFLASFVSGESPGAKYAEAAARLKAALARSGMQVEVAKPEELPSRVYLAPGESPGAKHQVAPEGSPGAKYQMACDCLVLNDVPAAAIFARGVRCLGRFPPDGEMVLRLARIPIRWWRRRSDCAAGVAP